jgi:hypothetical protein
VFIEQVQKDAGEFAIRVNRYLLQNESAGNNFAPFIR